MKMIDLLKKTLAFGMGTVAFSAEKLKQFADDMVARGEMTSEEAGKFVDEMTKRAEEEKRTVQEWLRDQMSKMLQQVGAADTSRVQALEQRIAALEEKLGVHTAAEPKPSEAEDAGSQG
ncbi:MAG: phasin family protein [Armatimonadota bacterium]